MVLSNTVVYLNDFGTGVLVGLASLGVRGVNVSGLDVGLSEGFKWLESVDCDLRFHMVLDDLYGDCPVGREAVSGAVSRGLGVFAEDMLWLDVGEPELFWGGLPLSSKVWREVACIVRDHTLFV